MTSTITPTKAPAHSVRRVKAEAVRKLRTPKITAIPLGDEATSSSSEGSDPSTSTTTVESPERRVTRSVSRQALNSTPMFTSVSPMIKTPPMTPRLRGPIIGIAATLTPDACLVTPRRSMRLSEQTPGGSPKPPASRKRPRGAMEMMTGVTPVVAGLSLQDRPPRLLPPTAPIPTPSRSAPTSPRLEQHNKGLKTSKWSLSKLEETRKKLMRGGDGVIRVSEVADDDDEGPSDDVMREPPSKIRRFYGYMRRMFWGK
uniref:Uncharacterized protein n=1 Tax=Caenorhabditis tropicalis TaxID=1561998 RepID=A0A1I7THH4_9PELO